jgi:hypothetical protein
VPIFGTLAPKLRLEENMKFLLFCFCAAHVSLALAEESISTVLPIPVKLVGEAKVGTQTKIDFEMVVPAAITSFLIETQGSSDDTLAVTSVITPSGEAIIGQAISEYADILKDKTSNPFAAAQLSRNRIELTHYQGFHAVLVPNYVAPPFVESGKYAISVLSYQGAKASDVKISRSQRSSRLGRRSKMWLISQPKTKYVGKLRCRYI